MSRSNEVSILSVREFERRIRTSKSSMLAESIVGQWDPYQLRQVFVNVIANAVDASQENSPVLISTELLSTGN